jgi:DNA-binding transcriptional MerR regulator
MTKKEMENKLRGLIEVLINGDKVEFRQAKKDIDSLMRRERATFNHAAPVIFEYLPKFDEIVNIENKKHFLSGLDLFFYVLGEEYFDQLKDFSLKAIQHPHGHIREAARHAIDWLHFSLTGRASPYLFGRKNLSEKKQEKIALARDQYFNFVEEIKKLLDQYKSEDEDMIYIYEMKPSVSKSLQQLWFSLTESPVYGEVVRSRSVTLDIFMKRKEIERGLTEMLKRTKSDYSLDNVLDAIYTEEDSDDLTRIVRMFDRGGDISELSDALELVTDAWNYFPHQSLNGLSPDEVVKGDA